MANIRQYIGARYVTKIYENSLDPSSAEWEANVNYEPLTMVTYNNGSYLSKKYVPGTVGNPASNTNYWVQTGFYNGQIASLQAQIDSINDTISDILSAEKLWVTPEDYGAIGDGVTDDTQAVQDAFNNGQNILLTKEYKITDTLFINGHKHITGGGTIHAYLPGTDPFEYLMLLGVAAIGTTGTVFSGIIEDITVKGHSGNYNYVIGALNAQDMIIKNCNFDFSTGGNVKNKIVMIGNNADISGNDSSNSNYCVMNCYFITDSDASSDLNKCESLGIELRDHVSVLDNTFINCKDDAPGVHGCSDVNISHNYMYSYSGRIYCSNSKNVDISENTIVVAKNIHCQGIQITPEIGYSDIVCENVTISHNLVDYRGTDDSVGQYGIRVSGTTNVIIDGNTLLSDQNVQGRIICEPFNNSGSYIYSENIEICNNYATTISHAVGGTSYLDVIKPFYVHDNIAKYSFIMGSNYDITRNNILLRDAALDEYALSLSKDPANVEYNSIWSFNGTISTSEQNMTIDGFPELIATDKMYLNTPYSLKLYPDIALAGANNYVFKIYKNESLLATITKKDNTFDIFSLAYASRLISSGDKMTVTCSISGTVPSPAPTSIQLGLKIIPFKNI